MQLGGGGSSLSYGERSRLGAEELDSSLQQGGGYQYVGTDANVPSVMSTLPHTGLPKAVLERYASGAQECRCGFLSAIARAWASIDSDLFLWVPGEVHTEASYSTGEQVIVAVGATQPPESFRLPDGASHLLIVCTPVDATLLGLRLSRSGTGSPHSVLHGQPMQIPGFSCSTDSIVPQCIATGPYGRVFFGGDDGCLHELKYEEPRSHSSQGGSVPSRLFSSRRDFNARPKVHRKACSVNKRLYVPMRVPSFVSNALFKQYAVLHVAVDCERMLVYTLMDNGSINMHSLGRDGTEPARRVGEAPQPSGGSSRRVPVAIAPISRREGGCIGLVAAFSNGSRQFYPLTGCHSNGSSEYNFASKPRDRTSPNRPDNQQQWPHVESCLPLDSCAVMLDAPENSPNSIFLLCTRDWGVDKRGRYSEIVQSHAVDGRPAGGIVEENVEERNRLLRKANMVAEGSGNELHAQFVTPPRRFAAMTTAGIERVQLKRPVDMVAEALQVGSEQMKKILGRFGEDETCCMLAAINAGVVSVSDAVSKQAMWALKSPELGGEPKQQQPHQIEQQQQQDQNTLSMGTPFVSISSPRQSGLNLLVNRAHAPVWDQHVLKVKQPDRLIHSQARVIAINIPREHLEFAYSLTKCVHSFVARLAYEEGPESAPDEPKRQEAQNFVDLSKKLSFKLEAMSLLEILQTEDIEGAEKTARAANVQLIEVSFKFSSFVENEDGKEKAKVLIDTAIDNRKRKHSSQQQLVTKLEHNCPSLYGHDDQQFVFADTLLDDAFQESSAQKREQQLQRALEAYAESKRTMQKLDSVLARLLRSKNFEAVGNLIALLAEKKHSGALEKAQKAAILVLCQLLRRQPGNNREQTSSGSEREYLQLLSDIQELSQPNAGVAAESILRRISSAKVAALDRAVALSLIDEGHSELVLTHFNDRLQLLDAHLSEMGNNTLLRSGSAIDEGCVNRLKLAARCRHLLGRYAEASDLWELLASRPSPESDSGQNVSFDSDRVYCLKQAKIAAQAERSTGKIDRLDALLRTAQLQDELRRRLETQEVDRSSDDRAALKTGLEEQVLESVGELIYSYAYPLNDWEICLRALDIFNGPPDDKTIRTVKPRDYWDGVIYYHLRRGYSETETLARVKDVASKLSERSWVLEPAHIAGELALIACGRGVAERLPRNDRATGAKIRPKDLADCLVETMGGGKQLRRSQGALRAANACADALEQPETGDEDVRKLLLKAGAECVQEGQGEVSASTVAQRLLVDHANQLADVGEVRRSLQLHQSRGAGRALAAQ